MSSLLNCCSFRQFSNQFKLAKIQLCFIVSGALLCRGGSKDFESSFNFDNNTRLKNEKGCNKLIMIFDPYLSCSKMSKITLSITHGNFYHS